MSEQSTREVVTDLYDAYERRDFDRVAELIDNDIEWIIYAPMQVFPFAGYRRGKAAVLQALAGIAKDYELKSYVPQVVVVDGDRAAVMSDVAFMQRATERTLHFHLANFLRIQNGRLIEFREFANTFDVVEQALGRTLPL
jgi:ketosteroid isomerase-like protein